MLRIGLRVSLYNAANNQITNAGFSYDAAGNVLSDGFNRYSYDGEGNVIAVNGGQTASYTYDALNHRVETLVGGSKTWYLYNSGGRRVSEWDGASDLAIEDIYLWGGHPVAYALGGATYFEHPDWLGTERLRTSYDGGVSAEFRSGVYGDGLTAVIGSSNDANHFTSLDADTESGTTHAWFRQLSTTAGRWFSPDPYSGSYDPLNPQSMNRYAYVLGNPLVFNDPLGLYLTGCFYTIDDNGNQTVYCPIDLGTIEIPGPGGSSGIGYVGPQIGGGGGRGWCWHKQRDR